MDHFLKKRQAIANVAPAYSGKNPFSNIPKTTAVDAVVNKKFIEGSKERIPGNQKTAVVKNREEILKYTQETEQHYEPLFSYLKLLSSKIKELQKELDQKRADKANKERNNAIRKKIEEANRISNEKLALQKAEATIQDSREEFATTPLASVIANPVSQNNSFISNDSSEIERPNFTKVPAMDNLISQVTGPERPIVKTEPLSTNIPSEPITITGEPYHSSSRNVEDIPVPMMRGNQSNTGNSVNPPQNNNQNHEDHWNNGANTPKVNVPQQYVPNDVTNYSDDHNQLNYEEYLASGDDDVPPPDEQPADVSSFASDSDDETDIENAQGFTDSELNISHISPSVNNTSQQVRDEVSFSSKIVETHRYFIKYLDDPYCKDIIGAKLQAAEMAVIVFSKRREDSDENNWHLIFPEDYRFFLTDDNVSMLEQEFSRYKNHEVRIDIEFTKEKEIEGSPNSLAQKYYQSHYATEMHNILNDSMFNNTVQELGLDLNRSAFYLLEDK